VFVAVLLLLKENIGKELRVCVCVCVCCGENVRIQLKSLPLFVCYFKCLLNQFFHAVAAAAASAIVTILCESADSQCN